EARNVVNFSEVLIGMPRRFQECDADIVRIVAGTASTRSGMSKPGAMDINPRQTQISVMTRNSVFRLNCVGFFGAPAIFHSPVPTRDRHSQHSRASGSFDAPHSGQNVVDFGPSPLMRWVVRVDRHAWQTRRPDRARGGSPVPK